MWATSSDVLDRWVGADKPSDTDLVSKLIDDAEAIVLSEYPKIQDRIDAGTLNENVLIMVVTEMVSRRLRNPEGLSYLQQMTGPFSQGKSYAGAQTGIYLSPDEVRLLAPNRGGKAFEVNLAPNAIAPTELPASDYFRA